MYKKVTYFFTLLIITSIFLVPSKSRAQETFPYVITLFFKPDLHIPSTPSAAKMQEHMETPGKFSYKLHKKELLSQYKMSGICTAYAGYFALSDSIGQVTFPRKNQKPQIPIIVTQAIKPIFVPTIEFPTKTILYWQIIKATRTDSYFAQLKKEENNDYYFWNIEKQTLPKDGKVPSDALIIFADPKYIRVPTGVVQVAPNSPNFVLPDIYVHPKLNTALSALRFLKIKKYFSPIPFEYKNEPQGYISHINP